MVNLHEQRGSKAPSDMVQNTSTHQLLAFESKLSDNSHFVELANSTATRGGRSRHLGAGNAGMTIQLDECSLSGGTDRRGAKRRDPNDQQPRMVEPLPAAPSPTDFG